MKKLVILPLVFMLSGCSLFTREVPVQVKFPDAPETLTQQCQQLKEATEGMTLTEFTKIVVENYVMYHECSVKVKGWNDWYTEQKKIFENPTKK